MARRLSIFVVALLALPVLAQEEGFQRRRMMEFQSPLDQIKDVLSKAGTPLTADQEKALKPIADAHRKAMEQAMSEVRERMRESGGERSLPRREGPGPGRGPGAGVGGGGMRMIMNPEMQKLNQEFQEKVKSVLTAPQNEAWARFQTEQIRRRGGFDAFKLNMQEAGAPLTPEQEQEVAAAFQDYNRQRGQLFREGRGQPDPATMEELERAHLSRLTKLLTPAQRRALVESRRRD